MVLAETGVFRADTPYTIEELLPWIYIERSFVKGARMINVDTEAEAIISTKLGFLGSIWGDGYGGYNHPYCGANVDNWVRWAQDKDSIQVIMDQVDLFEINFHDVSLKEAYGSGKTQIIWWFDQFFQKNKMQEDWNEWTEYVTFTHIGKKGVAYKNYLPNTGMLLEQSESGLVYPRYVFPVAVGISDGGRLIFDENNNFWGYQAKLPSIAFVGGYIPFDDDQKNIVLRSLLT